MQTGPSRDGATFSIAVPISADGDLAAARGELYGLVQRHLSFAAIPLALVGAGSPPPAPRPGPRDLLALSDLFGALEAGQIDAIARFMHVLRLPAGDLLFQKLAQADAFWVIVGWTVAITREGRDVTAARHCFGPGCSIGLVGLLESTPMPRPRPR